MLSTFEGFAVTCDWGIRTEAKDCTNQSPSDLQKFTGTWQKRLIDSGPPVMAPAQLRFLFSDLRLTCFRIAQRRHRSRLVVLPIHPRVRVRNDTDLQVRSSSAPCVSINIRPDVHSDSFVPYICCYAVYVPVHIFDRPLAMGERFTIIASANELRSTDSRSVPKSHTRSDRKHGGNSPETCNGIGKMLLFISFRLR